MKKSVSLLLSLLMVISIITSVPLTASAASTSDLKFKLSDNGKSYYVSDCKTSAKGKLVIPSTYKNKPVTRIGKDAFEDCTSLKSIKIPDSVKSIDYRAFYNCKSLKSIEIPDSVTSIGFTAFYGCTSLKSIVIPDSVTKLDGYAFVGCTSLKSVTIGSGVTSIDDKAFYNCTSLTSLTISGSVKSIGEGAFDGCTNLSKVNIEDIASWCSIDFACDSNPLHYAKNLYVNGELAKDIVIPDSVTSIGAYAFSDCTSLKSIKIPDSVTSIEFGAFADCTSLTSVTIGNGVTSIGAYAFEKCKNLTSITIPDSVTSIDFGAFADCTSLTSVTIGNGVTSIGSYAFGSCKKLKEIYWKAKNVNDFPGSGSVFYSAGANGSGIKVVFGDSVERIPANAFKNVKKVTSITIPDTVKSIGYLAFYNTGYYNDRNNWDKSALYIGNHLIRAKTSLKGDYTIKKGTKTIADNAFLNRENITSVTIPGSVKNIGKNAFRSCKSLTEITIPDTVKSIGYLAFYDTGYYNNRKNWDKSALYIGNHLIRGRHSLTGEYKVKDGTITIADMAFRDCDKLTSVKYPSSVKNVGKNIFYQCDKIK